MKLRDDFVLNRGNDFVVLFGIFEEVRNVKEGVSLEADIHECGLHAGQDFRYLTFIYVADDALRSVPLDVKLNELVVLEDRKLGLLRCRGNDQFFLHLHSCAHS